MSSAILRGYMKKFILILSLLSLNLFGADSFKLIPNYGVLTLKTENEDFKAKVNAGVSLEKMLSTRFSLGILFNYSNFEFQNYYLPMIKSNVYSLGANGKFFIIDNGLFRPFLGGGFLYNWNKLNYNYNYNYSYNYYGYNNYNNYNQDYTVNSFSGLLTAGTELRFAQGFGLNLDFRYMKGLSKEKYPYYYYSNSLLESVGRGMQDADVLSFNFGILISI